MSTRLQAAAVAKLFLIPWGLASTWACMIWFFRIYERGFRYNPYILQFEFRWSQLLLLVFGVGGLVLYQRSKAALPGWSKALYLLLITLAASILVLDLFISQFVTPAP
jgi:hypothetical protein